MEQQNSTTSLQVPNRLKAHQMKPGSNPAKTLDEDLSENIEALKEQVEIAIKSVDENLIDSMLVGQTKIQKNKAVILSWSLDQAEKRDVFHNGDLTEDQEDGIVLYVGLTSTKLDVWLLISDDIINTQWL